MKVSTIHLKQFRNQKNNKYKLSKKTVITGNNGAGKTTILEAIRIVSVGKSFKTSRFDDLIEFDKNYFQVSLKRGKDLFEYFYGTQFEENPVIDRQLSINNQKQGYLEFLGKFPSVSFSPKDVDIITGQPGLRRQFIDSILWQAHPEFRRDQLEYSKVLKERSKLLFFLKINRATIDELQPWNELLVGLSKKIRAARASFVEFTNKQLKGFRQSLPGKIAVQLEMDVSNDDLASLEQQEIRLGHNLYGPHRDELKIYCNDQLARRFSSRGQARSIIALLKAIEARYIKEKSGIEPIIILDDIVSELDRENIAWLFSIYGESYQLIATSVEKTPVFEGWEELKLNDWADQ